MKLLFTEQLAELNALNSEKLFVEATSWKITMRLQAVVAITNYKALAAAGRVGDGASFDARTRTLTVYLKQKSECEQHDGGFFVDYFRFLRVDSDTWERAVAVYQYDNFDALLQLAKRLAKKGAKTFSSTQEATAGRGARARAATYGYNDPRRPPQHMDIPVWEKDADGKGHWRDAEC